MKTKERNEKVFLIFLLECLLVAAINIILPEGVIESMEGYSQFVWYVLNFSIFLIPFLLMEQR